MRYTLARTCQPRGIDRLFLSKIGTGFSTIFSQLRASSADSKARDGVVLLAGAGAAQLPPAMQMDLYEVEAERHIESGDF